MRYSDLDRWQWLVATGRRAPKVWRHLFSPRPVNRLLSLYRIAEKHDSVGTGVLLHWASIFLVMTSPNVNVPVIPTHYFRPLVSLSLRHLREQYRRIFSVRLRTFIRRLSADCLSRPIRKKTNFRRKPCPGKCLTILLFMYMSILLNML